MGELDDIDLKTNPEPRVACVLLLDTSGSMAGNAIQELNDGLSLFQTELQNDPVAQQRVEAAVVTFGGSVQVLHQFASADKLITPTMAAQGKTPMGAAINIGLDLIAKRKEDYRRNNINYYRPWMFLITDGVPTDEWRQAAERLRNEEDRGSVIFFAVGVQGADFDVLGELSTKRGAKKLQGTKFRELFLWLSKSMEMVSASALNEKTQLPAVDGWAEV